MHTRMEMTGRSMPLKDRIDLGPLDKYTVYNKFPYKMALHILLTILMTMTIFVQVQTNQAQQRSQILVWYQKFLWNQPNDPAVPTMDMFSTNKLLFTTQELKNLTETSIKNYYDMDNNAADFENYQLSH